MAGMATCTQMGGTTLGERGDWNEACTGEGRSLAYRVGSDDAHMQGVGTSVEYIYRERDQSLPLLNHAISTNVLIGHYHLTDMCMRMHIPPHALLLFADISDVISIILLFSYLSPGPVLTFQVSFPLFSCLPVTYCSRLLGATPGG